MKTWFPKICFFEFGQLVLLREGYQTLFNIATVAIFVMELARTVGALY
jgi:hypothetical protein